MEHSRCVVAASPHSVVAVSAVHTRPTFDAGIAAETSFTMTLCYAIDLGYTVVVFLKSKADGKGMNECQS